MTLFVASLDAAFSVSNVRKVMTEFLVMLFSEHVDGLDHLLHELPRHVEGWLSIAITRNIAARAREQWFTLANRGVHEPGLIPTGDVGEIVRLLNWMVTSREQKSLTSLGDAYALSIVMHTIGIDLLSTGGAASEQNENRFVVCLVTDPISTSSRGQFQRLNERTGMRVPLQCMEERVSVWPGTPAENNDRREVFNDGVRTTEGLVLEVSKPYRENNGALVLWYQVTSCWEDSNRRIDTLVHRLAKELFPVTTMGVETCLRSIADDSKDAGLLERLKGDFGPIVQYIAKNSAILVRLQTFVMGYYYYLLHHLLDFAQLSISQAVGSRSWSDIRMVTQVGTILSMCRINVVIPPFHGRRNFYKHHDIQITTVFFRYLGRFVRRANPSDCEYAILEDSTVLPTSSVVSGVPDVLAHERRFRVRDSRSYVYTSGPIPSLMPGKEGFDQMGPPTLMSTGIPEKFRTCLRTWYWRNGFHALPNE